MKYFYRISAAVLGFAALLLAGCNTDRRAEAAAAHVGDESAPDFVAGPASLLLTNVDGFSAHVVETIANPITPRVISGDLIGRQGRLIFQPETTSAVKKGKIIKGGMFFIWDVNSQSGYALSEALQGYAPIAPPVRIASVTADMREPVSESIDGHACHRSEVMVEKSDGSTTRLTAWTADDLKHFPVRIRTGIEGRQVTVDLSSVHLDLPRPDLFNPPASFTKYASAEALMNELMIRQSTLKEGRIGEMPEPDKSTDNSWRQPTVSH